MVRYILTRALRAAGVVLGVLVGAFILLRLSGDPVTLFVAEGASAEQIASVRHQLGLDRPVHVQLAYFIRRALVGDFGRSLRLNAPALEVVVERLPRTFALAVVAILLAAVIGIPLGVLSALYRGRFPERVAAGAAAVGLSIPTFWLGMMLVIIFAVQLHLLPTSGLGGWRHLVLPAVTLSAYPVAAIMRLVRSGMLEVLGLEFVRTARAKGLPERTVIFRHTLRNAAISVVTLLGLQFSTLMGGAIITETVFAWPGVGLLLVQSIFGRDYAVVQTALVLLAFCVVLVNTTLDLLYAWLDPRIRISA